MEFESQGAPEVQAGSSDGGGGQQSTHPRVAVVAAGAGARGAYEAGALSVLVPWLCKHGRRPSIFVGTSAGAINATLFAAVAHMDPKKGAQQVLEAWRSLRLHKVFRSPGVSVPLKTAPSYIGQVLGRPRAHVVSLLDTTPLQRTGRELFNPHAQALHNNIHGRQPVVDALAVVTTDDRDRTVVFADLREGMDLPASDRTRAIDYQPMTVSSEHVLASAAIPALFHPIEINGRWYVDGGVRLNVPLKPALDLGATALAIVATHPATYPNPAAPPHAAPSRPPDVVDGIVALLGVALADRMVEDIHTLGKVNKLVGRHRSERDYREIPYVFVGPASRHELGAHAAEMYGQRFGGVHALRELDFAAIHRLIGPREHGAGDLLSYPFFDRGFIDDAIKLGINDAEQVIGSSEPWAVAHGHPAREQPGASVPSGRAGH